MKPPGIPWILVFLLWIFPAPFGLPTPGAPSLPPSPATQIFEEKLAEGRHFARLWESAKALASLNEALALPDLTPQQRRQILLQTAALHLQDFNLPSAETLLLQILGESDIDGESFVEAHLSLCKIHSNTGNAASWLKVRESCEKVLAHPHAPAAGRLAARTTLVSAHKMLLNLAEARNTLLELAADPSLSALERAAYQVQAARIALLEENAPLATELLATASQLLAEAGNNGVHSTPQLDAHSVSAELQLAEALCLLAREDADAARQKLLAVVNLRGLNPGTPQYREAVLHLHFQKWLPRPGPVLKVLFIGSSHTIRGNLPLLVERLAASAPPGAPRIAAGEHTRLGTGMRIFWEEGEGPGTVRRKIQSHPWDAVVVETFYKNPPELLHQYARNYRELAQSREAKLVLYESPAARALAHPEAFLAFHETNLWLRNELGVALAPSVTAWLKILGPKPSENDFNTLYADWIHATSKGAYLSACCLYAALTGHSPSGLYHPDEITPAEALLYQQAAWQAFLESNPAP